MRVRNRKQMNRRCHLEIMLIEHVRFRFILILNTLQPAVSILERITNNTIDRIDRIKNTRKGQIEPRILYTRIGSQDRRTKNTKVGQNQEYQDRIEPRILGQDRRTKNTKIGQNQEYQDSIEQRILGQDRTKNTRIGYNQ